jgi:hypothetical protein
LSTTAVAGLHGSRRWHSMPKCCAQQVGNPACCARCSRCMEGDQQRDGGDHLLLAGRPYRPRAAAQTRVAAFVLCSRLLQSSAQCAGVRPLPAWFKRMLFPMHITWGGLLVFSLEGASRPLLLAISAHSQHGASHQTCHICQVQLSMATSCAPVTNLPGSRFMPACHLRKHACCTSGVQVFDSIASLHTQLSPTLKPGYAAVCSELRCGSHSYLQLSQSRVSSWVCLAPRHQLAVAALTCRLQCCALWVLASAAAGGVCLGAGPGFRACRCFCATTMCTKRGSRT